MNKAVRTLFSLHRITGTIIALFFLMWFFTGLVLIYHSFPRLSSAATYSHMSALPQTINMPDTLPQQLKSLSIRSFQGQTVLQWKAGKSTVTITDNNESLRPVTFQTVRDVAADWIDAPIAKVDTLYDRDQWIMYSRYERDMPIYKFYFDDPDQHQLYIASRTATPLQLTDRTQRFWSWIGAIPHKFYFPFMRRDVDKWKIWLALGGSLCLIASLSGLIVALYLWIRNRLHTSRWYNPFKTRLLRLHFTFGLVFAIPLIAWSISGIMSMQKVPTWIVPIEGERYVSQRDMWGGGMLPLSQYRLSYATLRQAYPELKQIDYTRRGSIPVYDIIVGDTTLMIDASTDTVRPLFIPPADIFAGLRNIHGDDAPIHVTLQNHYDSQYFSISGRAELPVYKATVDNPDGSLYYIDPRDGHITYLNHNKILRRYLFSGIHYLNLSCFTGHPLLWKVCMWIICLAGIVFCFTSAWLGVKYIRRKLKLRCPHDC